MILLTILTYTYYTYYIMINFKGSLPWNISDLDLIFKCTSKKQ